MCWADRASATVLYATEKFRTENPKTYRAFTAALAEAAKYASTNPEGAVDAYVRISKSKVDRNLLLKIIKNPQVQFSVEPQNTYALSEFLFRVGAIKKKPASWRDYFFDDPVITKGG
jgi:NitT/TauT family transport system substrate-binding protein